MAITLNGTTGITSPDINVTAQTTGFTTTGNLTAADLTLSGGVYLGGTGSANYLDDYEEGTWTPRCAVEGQGNMTLSNPKGYYVKVGNVVTATMNTGTISGVLNPSSARAWEIHDFPFTTKGTPSIISNAAVRVTELNLSAYNGIQCFLYSDSTYGRIEVRTATGTQNSSNFADGASAIITFTYIAN